MGAWLSASEGFEKSKIGGSGSGNRFRSLEVRNLAGRSLSLSVEDETTCAELASAIEAQLGAAASHLDGECAVVASLFSGLSALQKRGARSALSSELSRSALFSLGLVLAVLAGFSAEVQKWIVGEGPVQALASSVTTAGVVNIEVRCWQEVLGNL